MRQYIETGVELILTGRILEEQDVAVRDPREQVALRHRAACLYGQKIQPRIYSGGYVTVRERAQCLASQDVGERLAKPEPRARVLDNRQVVAKRK